jgi:hypothetical protein
MSATDWLEMARADAERRGLAPLVTLLDGLATSMQTLRDATAQMDADEARAADATDAAEGIGAHHVDHASRRITRDTRIT